MTPEQISKLITENIRYNNGNLIILEDLNPQQIKVIRALASDNEVFEPWFASDPNKIDNDRVKLELASTELVEFTRETSDALTAVDCEVDLHQNNVSQDILKNTGKPTVGIDQPKKVVKSVQKLTKVYSDALSELQKYIGKVKFLDDIESPKNILIKGLKKSNAGLNLSLVDVQAIIQKEQKAYGDLLAKKGTSNTNYTVIISRDAVDIASMSDSGQSAGAGAANTESRPWSSCTDIHRYNKVYYEVMCPGMVAYLIDLSKFRIDSEQGIRGAVGRIHIRKAIYTKEDGTSTIIAVPEMRIYGVDPTQKFMQMVLAWIKSKGQKIEYDNDKVKVVGSRHSDTFKQSGVNDETQEGALIINGKQTSFRVSDEEFAQFRAGDQKQMRQILSRLPKYQPGVAYKLAIMDQTDPDGPFGNKTEQNIIYIIIDKKGQIQSDGSKMSQQLAELWKVSDQL